MRTSLASLLAAKPVLLADGATGTNLFDMGLTSGDAPELCEPIRGEGAASSGWAGSSASAVAGRGGSASLSATR